MGGSQTFEGLSREALDEHRQIHFYLDRIARSLEKLKEGSTDVDPMRLLAAEIEGLKERLREHQHNEEDGGLFQAILEVLPARRVEIDRLTNQHGKMIEILEMARIHALHGKIEEADALCADLESFLDMFRRHERAEERLLAQALGDEDEPPPTD
jgi:hemerythrin-like domain-containing protein